MKRFHTTLLIFLLPAILVAALAAALNLGSLFSFNRNQNAELSLVSNELSVVSEANSLVVDLWHLHGEVSSVLEGAASGKLDEAMIYRMHSKVVNEMALLGKRIGALQKKAENLHADSGETKELLSHFEQYRNFIMMATDIASIDPKTAIRYIENAKEQFMDFAHDAQTVSNQLTNSANIRISRSQQASSGTFIQILLIGLLGLVTMLVLSYFSASRLSQRMATIIEALAILSRKNVEPPPLPNVIQMQAETSGDIKGMADAVLSFREALIEQKKAEDEVYRLAYFDNLTHLPNRSFLLESLTQALVTDRRQEHKDALILLDIDRFKMLNDARGHDFGDALLLVVCERLKGVLRRGDTLARLSADEFGILILTPAENSDLVAAHYVMNMAKLIQDSMALPFFVGHDESTISVSLGIALFPEGADCSPIDILRRADTALHRAKQAGGGQEAFFDASMSESVQNRYQVERELRHAIPAGDLRLYLQPQVTASGKMVGAEALVRWQHAERGLVSPGAFIPVAEESNLIVDVGRWVLTEVCKIVVLESICDLPIRIAVNISPRHFNQPDFVAQIKKILEATGAEPIRLALEVTEGLVIDNINDVIAKMSELTALGFHFSIDDFGTGYSSLAYLKRLPIHELKIDKTFVQDVPDDPDDVALIEAILSVAASLHLQVVAEGVETKEQVEFLNSRGNVIHQGYFFGRPAPASEWVHQLLSTI